MYRVEEEPDLTQENPDLKIVEGEDNYFRLNIWGMGRAKVLATWGVSKLTVDDLIEHQWNMDKAEDERGAEGMRVYMNTATKFGVRCCESDEVEAKKLIEGTENFCSNFNYASAEECKIFADALSKAFDKLDAAIIQPDQDYEYYREFSEWLYKSPDGIFVG